MEFTELIATFARRHGVAGLAAEDGAAALDIDGIILTMVAANDWVTLSADIGEAPAEGAAAFADLLLETNLQTEAFFAKTADGVYVAVRRLPLPLADADVFDAAVEGLVNLAESWRKLLADFRPAAKAAAQSAAASQPTFGTSGFMQV